MNKLYKVREFAELAGVTVRALHHYDRLALLRPKRTGSQYRVYGISDLAYSPEALAKMEGKRAEWSPELQEKVSKDWNDLFREIEESMDEDPAGPKVQALVARWKALVGSFTGGDPAVSAGLKKAWADRPNWPASMQQHTSSFSNPKVWEFMQKALNCK